VDRLGWVIMYKVGLGGRSVQFIAGLASVPDRFHTPEEDGLA
jgi:hypothetical protein